MLDWALSISLSWWLVGALAIAWLWLFESSFREDRQLRTTISKLELKIFDGERRQKGVDALWDARTKGIKLREEVITEAQLPSWVCKWEKWKGEVLAAAAQVNHNLERYLEYLDQCPPIPGGLHIVNDEHRKFITAGTEMLLRMQEFLEREIK